MEELRSTEVLDKAIQADARKKAERILAKAASDSEALAASVAERAEQAEQEKIAQYEKKIAAYENDRKASLPLEKERFLVSFIQTAIEGGINDYLESLSEEKRIDLALCRLERYESVIQDKKVNAFVYGFDTDAARRALERRLKKNLASCVRTEFNRIVEEEDCGIKNKEGVILESEDRLIRCRLTLPELFSEVQNQYRAELCDALFGSGFQAGIETAASDSVSAP